MTPSADFDVVIVGASFAGLTCAHHLPKTMRVLIVDTKPGPGSTVESTGLITTKTRDEFRSFFDIDSCITNPISHIGVVASNFDDYFVSSVSEPWIYQTDTKGLVKKLAVALPPNVELRTRTVFLGFENDQVKIQTNGQPFELIATKFLVGADGSHSRVAAVTGLDRNKRFLFGYEQVFFGQAHLSQHPEQTIYHFWFGEFSLGYGGWLSPTVVQGRPAVRIGLAKLEKDRADAKALMAKFVAILLEKKFISIEGSIERPGYVFGSLIPIGGPLRRISRDNVLLIGDAAGFCGAFAADGIKGSVVSGKEAAGLIARYLSGDKKAPAELSRKMNEHGRLIEYYHKQLRYRWIWDQMRSNRTFRAMYDIIAAEKMSFLNKFCDSKDKDQSLARAVVKPRHGWKLLKYGWYMLWDIINGQIL